MFINFDELFPRDMLWKGLSTETQSVWIACERERSQRMMSWASADVVVRVKHATFRISIWEKRLFCSLQMV